MLNLNCKIKVYETKDLKPSGKVYQFTHVRDISIQSSYKKFTDTATITIPKSIVTNQFSDSLGIEIANRSPIDFEQRSIHEFFKLDYYIEIFLGYDGEYKPAFRGYIREVKGDAPVQIVCEDMMYYLKKYKMIDSDSGSKKDKDKDKDKNKEAKKKEDKKNQITSNKSKNVSDPIAALKDRFEKIKVPFEVAKITTEKIGETVINRECNIAEFLKILKKDLKIYSYFRLEAAEEKGKTVFKSVLYITNNPYQYKEGEVNTFLEKYKNTEAKTPLSKKLLKKAISRTGVNDILSFFEKNETYIGEGRLRFHYNIIDDDLKVKEGEVKKIRVRAEVNYLNSNVPIAAEIGDPDGKLLKIFRYHNNTEELNFENAEEYDKKVEEIKAKMQVIAGLKIAGLKKTGLTGSITTFGEPFMRPLDKISLENAEEPEKNGVFQIEEIERKYGINGYRQIISLGRVLQKEK